jgi:ABC-type multidrug transport system fused ATPase/permease subunit
LTHRNPSQVILSWLDTVQYILTIATSSYTLSRLISKNATKLILLNIAKTLIHFYRLADSYCTLLIYPLTLAGASSYEVLNKAYHRLNLMKNFAMEDTLRRDISVTNLEPWLLSQFKEASQELGDTPTKAPYMQRTSSQSSFIKTVIVNLIQSSEYIWLIYEGFRRGMTLGTLHLIRSSTDTIIYKMYELVGESHRATDEWKDLIAFFRCLEFKSEMANLEPKEYVSNPAGMKLEAREIRYKYDEKSETEVLKGTSFVINPGEMIAVVGYSLRYFTNSDSMVLENRLSHDC